jgi:hypothetical protein
MDCYCVSKSDPSHNHSAPHISNKRLSLQCFLMTKRHITDHILESSELFQEHAKKESLNRMYSISFSLRYKIYMESLSFSFFYMYVTLILKFLTCFHITKLNYNKYDCIIHTIMLHQDFTVLIANWWSFHARP